MKKQYLTFLSIFLLLCITGTAQTVVLSAVADNTIYNEFTNNSNGAGENFTAGVICTGNLRRGLVKFDLSSIPAGATITSASLKLVVNKAGAVAEIMSMHRLIESWGEGSSNAGTGADGLGATAGVGDATWNCSFANGTGSCTTGWTTAGGNFNSTASANVNVGDIGAYTWAAASLATDVQSMLDNALMNYGWIIKMTDESTVCTAKRFASHTSSVIADRPALTVSYTTVTPISLSYFTARAQQFGSLLAWETLQETNTAIFELQHSTDGQNFSSIGTVAAAGNSATPRHYHYTHQDANTGRNFYRMVQQDVNGQRTISNIERVDISAKTPILFIAPNPVTNKLILPGFDAAVGINYTILSIDGKQVASGKARSQSIDLPTGMKPGIYRLQLQAQDGSRRSANFHKQ